MQKYELINITKIINDNIILEKVNLKLERGKVYGLIGENGSGKTMLLRLMAGLIKPTGGKIVIDGKPCNLMKSKNINIGILIENIGLYPELTGTENLKYLASINKTVTREDINHILKAVGLDPEDGKKVRKYSLGMRQKLAIAQCFMESPDLILMDEPTNALDEDSVVKVLQLINTQAQRGAIVFIVSHIKENIFSVCDTIFSIKDGHISEVEKWKNFLLYLL